MGNKVDTSMHSSDETQEYEIVKNQDTIPENKNNDESTILRKSQLYEGVVPVIESKLKSESNSESESEPKKLNDQDIISETKKIRRVSIIDKEDPLNLIKSRLDNIEILLTKRIEDMPKAHTIASILNEVIVTVQMTLIIGTALFIFGYNFCKKS